jgi:hypothetical protein
MRAELEIDESAILACGLRKSARVRAPPGNVCSISADVRRYGREVPPEAKLSEEADRESRMLSRARQCSLESILVISYLCFYKAA